MDMNKTEFAALEEATVDTNVSTAWELNQMALAMCSGSLGETAI